MAHTIYQKSLYILPRNVVSNITSISVDRARLPSSVYNAAFNNILIIKRKWLVVTRSSRNHCQFYHVTLYRILPRARILAFL